MKTICCLLILFNYCFLAAPYKFANKINFGFLSNNDEEPQKNLHEYINVIEIKDISIELEHIIERFLTVSQKKNSNKCYKEAFVFIWIQPFFDKEITKDLIYDSLYKVNNFSKVDTSSKNIHSHYLLTINLLHKNNPFLNSLKKECKIYYYNYGEYRILLYSYYLDLQFNELKSKNIRILEKPFIYNSKCYEFNYSLDYVFYLNSTHVMEIRYKDILWPSNQVSRNMFK